MWKFTKWNQTNHTFLYRAKEITKKSIQQYNELNKVKKQNGCYIYEFWDPHRLLLNLFDKINLKRSDKYVALPNMMPCHLLYMEKYKKVIQS